MTRQVREPFRWRYWHRVVLLSSLGWVFVYADRSVLAPVLPLIHSEWNLTTAQLGAISSVFFLVYAVAQIPVGIASDRLGRRLVLLVPGFILFGIGTLLTGLAPSYLWLLVASCVTGLGQGTYYPTQFSLSTEVVPVARRAIAAALINSGQAVGISLGLLIASFLAVTQHGGWRLPFVVLSFPTIIVGLSIWWGIRRSHDHRPGPAASDSAVGSARPSLWSRRLVTLYIVNFCSNYGFFVILTWLPFYLQTKRGYAGSEVGWISSLVPWAAVLGGVVMSIVADRVDHRRSVALVMLPLAAVSLVAIPQLSSESALFVALLLYGFMGKLAIDPVLAAMLADSTEVSAYGRVFGVFNFAAMSSSIVAPYLTGMLADQAFGIEGGFYIAAVLLVVGMLCMWGLRGGSRFSRSERLGESVAISVPKGSA